MTITRLEQKRAASARQRRVMVPEHDPRLTKLGDKWYWDGEPVSCPVPKNSALSFAIAQEVKAEVKTHVRHYA